MHLSSPRYVFLDTATINYAAKCSNHATVKEFTRILNSGEWISYITFHQLQELASHGNDEVVERRLAFLANITNVAFPTGVGRFPAGDVISLRSFEIELLTKYPTASHEEIIDGVRPQIRSGFSSGKQFVADNLEWIRHFRTFELEKYQEQLVKVANATHFYVGDPKEKIPKRGQQINVPSDAEFEKRFAQSAQWFSDKMTSCGDLRGLRPEEFAFRFMHEAFTEARPLLQHGGNYFEALLARDGVDRNRLPKNARVEDVTFEFLFVSSMQIYARRLKRNKDELLKVIRKESVPSWMVWQEIDSRLRQMPKAETGNMHDKYAASFGLYVDILNVDKRIADIIRQAARICPLLKILHERIPRRRGFDGLVLALRQKPS